ncbi:suppressor of SWI4 1 homolog isoform X1 [Saccostrea echinata]|uniref:suppressor of SWI4 1 homolog isoform X1 n=1 Tax=Saccostrea echinata TaxID=191078 RepID=UPI002A80AEEC|nr:suppressor of SWI4 1 homolog isoform X1 [Saccostrea echinata]
MTKKKSKVIRSMKAKQSEGQEEDYRKAPHSFVFHRGHVGKNILQLIKDMRHVMEPYTASRLQVRKKNVLKDFVSIAGDLGVSHFLIYTKSEINVHLRVSRLSRGPTLTFRVKEYTLCKDVVSSLKKPNVDPKQFNHHPLLVMNNFSGEEMHLKLMSTMFQNMFPSININKVNLNNIKRCVMLNYNSEDKTIDFRHYNVKVVPVGLSKGVKKLIKAEVPDLSRYNDVCDFITKGGNLSESEAELDGEHNEVVLPQDIRSRGNIKAAKSAIRLTEIGPRMTLQLLKIEDGVCQGEVMFHELVIKTDKDLKDLKALRDSKRKLKELRKKQQDENVRKKKLKTEKHKQKCLEGMKRRRGEEDVEQPELGGKDYDDNANDEDDDDAAYYQQEVGEAPDPDLFQSTRRKRKVVSKSPVPHKKKKPNVVSNGDKSNIKDSMKGKNIKFSRGSKPDESWKVKGKSKGGKIKQKNRPDNKKVKRSGEITKKPKFKAKRKGRK